MPELGPDTEVRFVKGVGERRAKALAEAGIRRVSDLLLRLPYRYEDRSAGRPAREVRTGSRRRSKSSSSRCASAPPAGAT